jgi:hypothetical protein
MVAIAAAPNDQMRPRDQLLGFAAGPRADSRHGMESNLAWRLDHMGRGYRRGVRETFQRAYGIITVEIARRRPRPAAGFN